MYIHHIHTCKRVRVWSKKAVGFWVLCQHQWYEPCSTDPSTVDRNESVVKKKHRKISCYYNNIITYIYITTTESKCHCYPPSKSCNNSTQKAHLHQQHKQPTRAPRHRPACAHRASPCQTRDPQGAAEVISRTSILRNRCRPA